MRRELSFSLLYFKAVIFTLMFTVFNPSIIEAQQNSFNVDSYIPEKFIDTEWRISGGFGLRSNDYKYNNSSNPMDSYILYKRESDTDNQSIDFSNYYRYRYETIPKYLDARFNISCRGYRDKRYELGEREDLFGNYDKDIRDSEQKNYGIFFNPDIDCGIYLYDDYFLSAESDIRLSYYDYPKNDYVQENIDINTSSSGYIDRIFDKNNTQSDRNSKGFNMDICLLPGWGKVYEGEFASTAIYIIDELKKYGLLAQTPSDEQMQNLSEIIYQYRMKHSIDSRLHKIETIETIGNYLLDEGIITNSGPRGYMLIEDMWSYYHNFSRRFGIKIKAGFGLDYEYNKSERTSNNEYYHFSTRYHEDSTSVIDTLDLSNSSTQHFSMDKRKSRLPYAVAKVEYYKPFNHRWHLDACAQARYYFSAYSEITDSESETSEPNEYWCRKTDYKEYYYFDWENTLRYILNSRTYADLISNISYNYLSQEITEHTEIDSTVTDTTYNGNSYDGWQYSIALGLTYRISIPTTLTITGSYYSGRPTHNIKIPRYGYNGYTDHSNKGYSLRASISYYIL